MADDKLQILRPNGKDAEADKVAHDAEQAYAKEGQELGDKIAADKEKLAAMKKEYAIASGGVSATNPVFISNKTFGRIKSLQCSRDEPAPPPPPPKGTPEMTAWDGVEHGSAAEEYLKTARGGLDAVHGDTWHFQQSASVQDAAIGEGIGAALGKLLQLGGRFIGAAIGTVKPSAPRPAPAAKPASPGDGLYVAKVAETRGRPSWRQSEKEIGNRLGKEHREQVSFKNGEEVPYGTEGSTRPDWYKQGSSIEVKNYNIETEAGQSRLVNNVTTQAAQRAENLPSGTTQSLFLDVRGQNVSREALEGIVDRIGSQGIINPENITILR